ncbi:NUC169 domain-domain-containing protein [Leucosporidium creatinivorum]|uniref:Ribosome biogenesis protein ERB1 n=1 Tax=Leucosporidium creatinivorum TaxID=106004 RepID=A0A1Y2FD38_9BASI|nr:NUC169 domain-domain-containing protein [Leucosporidium creatinivorum]
MAPKGSSKAPKASTSKALPPKPSTVAPKRKRRSQEEEDAQNAFAAADSLGLGPEALAFGSDGEDEDDGEILDEDDEDDAVEEPFPELDFGESEDGSFDGEDGDDDDDSEDESLGEVDPDEEAALLAEIEAEDAEEDDGSDLDELIRRHTTKPDEGETPGTSWEEDPTLPNDYMKRSRTVTSKITGQEKTEWDQEIDAGYGSDSSTEETTNRIGNVPAYFYDDLPHIGYDIDGKKVMRPATGDELDKFLEGIEDADGGWTTVKDKLHQQNVALTEEELDLIHRLAKGENPDAAYDPYTPTIEYFSSKVLPTPLVGRPEPKSRFLPSKWEHKKVMKIVRAIRTGRIVPRRPGASSSSAEKPPFYGLWSQSDVASAPHPMHMPAPKLALPSHNESYNPPEEYLWTKDEKDEFNEREKEDKKGQVIPIKHSSLRQVAAYPEFVQERFERCLDLYLAPRMLRRRPKLDIKDPSELIPKLPSPQDLRPFPTTASVEYPHPNGVRTRCVSIDPTGMWVVTGAEDGEVRLWECAVGRCAMKWKCGDGPIYGVEWCPDKERSLFAVASSSKVHIIAPLPLLSEIDAARTSQFALAGFTSASTDDAGNAKKHTQPAEVAWRKPKGDAEREEGRLVEIDVPGTLKQIVWHKRGDYFSTVSAPAGNRSVLIHQLTKHQTQAPFTKQKGEVQRVSFHPSRPHFFVATQRQIRMYDLLKQELVKTLNPGLKWISSLDVHPLGDNLIVGSYDRRLVWHDLDLSSTPYKTLRYHSRALRQVAFSPVYPLFLSTSDDGSIHIFHSTVYSDLLTNPLIVPLKVLKGHEIKDSLGVLDAKWHPREPWVVSVGADGMGRLWCT